jgi:hypothetical protein
MQSNAETAEEIWDLYNHDLGKDFTGLFTALSHGNYNVRMAASLGLAAAMYEYPDSVQVLFLFTALWFLRCPLYIKWNLKLSTLLFSYRKLSLLCSLYM